MTKLVNVNHLKACAKIVSENIVSSDIQTATNEEVEEMLEDIFEDTDGQ